MLDVQEIANRIIRECGEEVLKRADKDRPDEVNNGSVDFTENGFIVSFNGDFAGFFEFGTGTEETVDVKGKSAEKYLSDKPNLEKEAMKFYKNGRGSIGAKPYLYPAILWALDEIPKRFDREVLAVWNNLRFK